MSKESYRNYIDLAEHYIALDMSEVHLFDWSSDKEPCEKPWEFVTTVEFEGTDSMKYGTGNVYFRFTAPHPDSGLTFSWSVRPFQDFDNANANKYPNVNKSAIVTMQENLSSNLWKEVRTALLKIAEQMDETIDDYAGKLHDWQRAQKEVLSFAVKD